MRMTRNGKLKTVDGLKAAEALNGYLRKSAAKNLSLKTIEIYKRRLTSFVEFVGEDAYVRTITSDTIDDYVLHLKEGGTKNDVTIQSHVRDVRAFLYYCMTRKELAHFKINLPKVDKKIKETYADDELVLLLAKPMASALMNNANALSNCYSSNNEYKTWAFSNFLIGTGCRISTALEIKISDLDFAKHTIQLNKQKNRKAQIIPMSQTLANILEEYLSHKNNNCTNFANSTNCTNFANSTNGASFAKDTLSTPSAFLFDNHNNEKGRIRTYQGMLALYNRSRGVNKTSAHLYRHTFAKKWILNGGDIFRLQKILGHSDLTMVRQYVEMFGNDIAIGFDKFNPLDNLPTGTK